jgi:hypothetical protein
LIAGCLSAGCRLAPRGPSVAVGLAAPFEGAQRDLGYEVLAAARLAIADQNAAGGRLGRPVTLIALNDEADPAGAVTAARKLVLDPTIIGVIGHWSSDATAAALPIYAAAGRPLIVPSASLSPAAFHGAAALAPSAEALAAGLVSFLRGLPSVRTIALRVNSPDLAAPFETALRAAGLTLAAPGAPADLAALWLDGEETARYLAGGRPPLVVLLNGPYLPLLHRLHPLDAGVFTWTTDAAGDADFAARFAAAAGHPPSLQARYAYRAARHLAGAPTVAGLASNPIHFAPAPTLFTP